MKLHLKSQLYPVFQRHRRRHRWKSSHSVFEEQVLLYAILNHLAHTLRHELSLHLIQDPIVRTNVPHIAQWRKNPIHNESIIFSNIYFRIGGI